MFAKDISASDDMICDAARKQIYQPVREFFHPISTSLHVIEEGTPWANRAEIYIGLLKKTISKDMK